MENQEQKTPCDPDDVVCQMEVLRHLKGLEQQLGSEAFLEKYPEAVLLKKRLPQEIINQQEVVDQAIDSCGREAEEAEEPAPVEDMIEEPVPEISPEPDE